MSSLSLLRGADAAILGSRGAAGAIVITLKDGRDLPARPAQGIITYSPLGYSDSVEFYHPTYDTLEKKDARRSDLRSTIYSNPALQLDEKGNAIIEYYTPDSTAPEDIIIEGIDENGKWGYVEAIGASHENVKAADNQEYGSGAFLMVASEMYKFAEREK